MSAIPSGRYHTFSPLYVPLLSVVTAPALHLILIPFATILTPSVGLEGRNCQAPVQVCSIFQQRSALHKHHVEKLMPFFPAILGKRW
jgi:hypothetical protein